VVYSLPAGKLGMLFSRFLVSKDVQKIFAYRRKVIGELFNSKI
jgi:hypothetical protein